jgi:hypothetical protein
MPDPSSDRLFRPGRAVSCNAFFHPASVAFDLTNLAAAETDDAMYLRTVPSGQTHQ